jgi:putative tryptophan/tyrosine transport system substrate-binding protein
MPPARTAFWEEAVLVKRRALLSSLALGLLIAPRSAGAQSAVGIPQIGLLRPDTPANPVDRVILDAFLSGLQEAGYEPSKNLRVEVRYAHGRLDRLPAVARELAALPVAAIVTANPYSTRAVREATSTIPIVVALDYETDPVASGWIASIARPGGNLTGLFLDQPEMSAKLLQLLKECVPGLMKVAVLWDEVVAKAQFDATAGAARTSGLSVLSLRVRQADDVGGAFDAAVRERANGLVVLTSPLFTQSRLRSAIAELALKHRLPGITLFTTFPAFGLLMAYGPDQADASRRAASQYVARILKGARPADLPVQHPDKFRLVISAKTAKALRVEVPQSIVLQADEILR